jgi:pimeloyl-ACP methyl ester carboxylesterase
MSCSADDGWYGIVPRSLPDERVPMKTALAILLATFAIAAPAQELDTPVTLRTSTGTIHGSLLAPFAATRGPVVLFVSGSGPTDRDGNQPRLRNDSLKQLAAALAANGVATLRYDKRGIGASREAGPSEKDLRFDQYVDDAAAWLAWLKADPRFSLVAVAGHSEGAHIGALAAAKAGAAAVISLSGLARKPADVLRTQLKPKLPEPFWKESERILAGLEKGETTDDVPSELMIVYRPSVQPYLISWFRHSPAEAVARLGVPVLVVQGTADVQVPTGEGEALRAAARRGELFLVQGMSHVLKRVTADPTSQMRGYTDPSVPIMRELAPRITEFVRAAAK